jgi:hypothetical protein
MAASTSDRYDIGKGFVGLIEWPVAGSTTIYNGIMVGAYTEGSHANEGCLVALSDAQYHVFVGVSNQQVVNTTVAAKNCEVLPKNRLGYIEVDATSPTRAWLGKLAYAVDDHTAAVSGVSHSVPLGRIVEIKSTATAGRVLIDVQDLASAIGS